MKKSRIFLTDADFAELFGPEIARITRALGKVAEEKCPACGGKCCVDIGCGLYSEKFSCCPIYEIRPRECRYHFCWEISNAETLSQEDREVLDKPVENLLGCDSVRVSEMFPLFPEFPLDAAGLVSLGIKEEVDSIVTAFESGKMDETQARNMLKELCLSTAK
ncbi:MAG: hypothetical protein J7K94_01035 [Dehalococcoidia bacterium]|nr:hypothetical protein [Dehalococcoidia bacterium]